MPYAADYLFNKQKQTYFVRSPTPILQVKIVRKEKLIHGKTRKPPLTLPISANHNNAHMYMDFFYVNGMDFLHTKSR